MSKVGRKSYADKPQDWKISLPSSLCANVELLLLNPLTGKPKWGARSTLISRLLTEWVDAQRKQPPNVAGGEKKG